MEAPMNIQSIIAEAHARADANNDGKLTVGDIESMANDHGIDKTVVDALKKHADTNGDGKVSPEDIGHVLQNPNAFVTNLKDAFLGHKV
jgi:hypothetical protein